MPGKNKSRNNSRKSTASSEGRPVVVRDENEYPSISIAPKPPVVKKKTPKNNSPKEEAEPIPEPKPEPKPVLTPWEEMNMTESEFNAMVNRVLLQYQTSMKKDYEDYLLDELDTPSYWERRIESLESQREYFNKKRGWSGADVASVEDIDAQIKECEKELARLEECCTY